MTSRRGKSAPHRSPSSSSLASHAHMSSAHHHQTSTEHVAHHTTQCHAAARSLAAMAFDPEADGNHRPGTMLSPHEEQQQQQRYSAIASFLSTAAAARTVEQAAEQSDSAHRPADPRRQPLYPPGSADAMPITAAPLTQATLSCLDALAVPPRPAPAAEPLPLHVETPVPVTRVVQTHMWDCALACVAAAATALCHEAHTLEQVVSLANTGCTWSVELLPVARRLGLAARLFTTQAACSPAHLATLPFYQARFGGRERLASVEALFASEEASGTDVVELDSALTTDQLCVILQRPVVVMVLVDASRLRCQSCEHGALVAQAADSFLGHFVIVHAIDKALGRVDYVNPAPHCCSLRCNVDLAAFEAARNAVGTDNDVLLITAPQATTGGGAMMN